MDNSSCNFVYCSETFKSCDDRMSRLATGGYRFLSAIFKELLVACTVFNVGLTRNKLFPSPNHGKMKYLWEMTSLFKLSWRALKYSFCAASSLSSKDDSDIPASPRIRRPANQSLQLLHGRRSARPVDSRASTIWREMASSSACSSSRRRSFGVNGASPDDGRATIPSGCDNAVWMMDIERSRSASSDMLTVANSLVGDCCLFRPLDRASLQPCWPVN